MFRGKRQLPLARLAFRNIYRHKRRTLLTGSAIAVAVAVMTYAMSHVDGLLYNMLDTYSRTESGHVRVRKEGFAARERFLPVHMFVPKLDQLTPALWSHDDVAQILPRIRTTVLVDGSDSNRPGLLLGMNVEAEVGYFSPEKTLVEGRLPQEGMREVLAARPYAEKLNVKVGDTITLLCQTAYRSLGGIRLTITGLSFSGIGYLDDMLLITNLEEAQIMTDLENACTEILIFSEYPDKADQLATTLDGQLEPLAGCELETFSWREQGQLIRLIEMGRAVFSIVLMILLLMAALIIVNTMLMTVMERTGEFGMQAAMGMRRRDIVILIIAEGVAIGLIGAVAGGLLGSGVAIWLEHTGINLGAAVKGLDLPFPTIVHPDWNLLYAIVSTIIGIITAGLAAVYPAWRAIRLTPAEALRK